MAEITLRRTMPFLLRRFPEMRPAWERHVRFWDHRWIDRLSTFGYWLLGKNRRGYYNDIAVFAHFTCEAYFRGDLATVQACFDALETLLEAGDPQVGSVAIVGAIEDIQNIASHEPSGYHVFEPFLGPRSLAGWRSIESMWVGRTTLAEVIRGQAASAIPSAAPGPIS